METRKQISFFLNKWNNEGEDDDEEKEEDSKQSFLGVLITTGWLKNEDIGNQRRFAEPREKLFGKRKKRN